MNWTTSVVNVETDARSLNPDATDGSAGLNSIVLQSRDPALPQLSDLPDLPHLPDLSCDAAALIEGDQHEPRQPVRGLLQLCVTGFEGHEHRINAIAPIAAEVLRGGPQRHVNRRDGHQQVTVVLAGARARPRTPNFGRRPLEHLACSVEHRVVRRRAPGSGCREHEQTRQLGGDLPQIFERTPGLEDVSRRAIVERLVQSTNLHGLLRTTEITEATETMF
ncbi:MAG: hypothetical protein ABJA98_04030 [Acidobacteriota bacterium]